LGSGVESGIRLVCGHLGEEECGLASGCKKRSVGDSVELVIWIEMRCRSLGCSCDGNRTGIASRTCLG
jgi:hypothetical protein